MLAFLNFLFTQRALPVEVNSLLKPLHFNSFHREQNFKIVKLVSKFSQTPENRTLNVSFFRSWILFVRITPYIKGSKNCRGIKTIAKIKLLAQTLLSSFLLRALDGRQKWVSLPISGMSYVDQNASVFIFSYHLFSLVHGCVLKIADVIRTATWYVENMDESSN